MPTRHRQYSFTTKESKELLDNTSKRFRIDLKQIFKGKVSVQIVEFNSTRIFLFNGEPVLAGIAENIYPTLAFREFIDLAPKVVVDMGAVPYVCKGANVMAPGIRQSIGEFKKGDFVVITDEKYGKSLAIGESLYDSEESRSIRKGVVIKNIHFVGDKTWACLKELSYAHIHLGKKTEKAVV
jgi:PUA domain protein